MYSKLCGGREVCPVIKKYKICCSYIYWGIPLVDEHQGKVLLLGLGRLIGRIAEMYVYKHKIYIYLVNYAMYIYLLKYFIIITSRNRPI